MLPLNSKVTLHYGIWYSVTFEFKLRYLKILKLFSIALKESFEPIVLQNKMRRVLLFKNIFLRNLHVSFSNRRKFYSKKNAKVGREITKNHTVI